jgi:XTP/dITP diphosphohydrolase
MKIVLASNNKGKVREFQEILQDLNIELIPQSALDIPDVEETGLTFIENAILKARHAAKLSGLPAIADDSGLAVKALHGAPGIYSARYAGLPSNSNQNIQKLLHEMQSIPKDQRQAQFHCVLAFLSHADDPTPLITDGIWRGTILAAPRGEGGFGYDPIFFLENENKTAAELPAPVKNKISHRGIALQSFIKLMPEKLCTLSQSSI